jgi:Cu/Zn superoxide dismutase
MRIALAVSLALLAISGCSQMPKVETDPERGAVDVDVEPSGQGEAWSATLSAVGGSGVSGSATASDMNDATHATVTIAGARSGGVHPWHIHEGRCGDANPPIVGPASAYPPLTVGSGGGASAQAHIPVELNEAKNYIVNVHASPTNLGTIVACGDLND